jgi:ketosteroid isomerase-like protein
MKLPTLKTCLFVVLALIAFAIPAFSQVKTSGKQYDELVKVNKAYDQAIIKADLPALEKILASEYIYTATSGTVLTRAQQVETVKSDLRIESGGSRDVEVRVYGKMAIVLGYFEAKGKFAGKPFESVERYISIWTKRGGRWQLVAEQGTTVR